MRKSTEKNKGELELRGVRFFKGDLAFLDENFPNLGHTIIIRKLTRDFVNKTRERQNQNGTSSSVQLDDNFTIDRGE